MRSLFVFPEDFASEGVQRCADRIAALDVHEIVLCFVYHAARDLVPHEPFRVVKRQPGLQFALPSSLFSGSEVEPDQRRAYPPSLLDDIRSAATARGMSVAAWSVYLHNEELGERYPQLSMEDCFGHRAAPSDLCPAQPRVQDYCVDVTQAAAEMGFTKIYGESLHYGWYQHGYHHDRDFARTDPLARFLLGLCFCTSCSASASEQGVNTDVARKAARQAITERLVSAPSPGPHRESITLEDVAEISPELAAFCHARTKPVIDLVDRVATAAAITDTEFVFLDMTGARRGYVDGEPGEASNVSESWQIGINLTEIAARMPIGTLAYAKDPMFVERDAAAYAAIAGGGAKATVIVRPGEPDCDSAQNLRAKVAAIEAAGVTQVMIYCYSLFDPTVLARLTTV